MNRLLNAIVAMSDVEFALAFFAAAMLWTGVLCLLFWAAEQATKKIRNRRNRRANPMNLHRRQPSHT